MTANWLARRVIPLKKHVYPGWEYGGLLDLTWETFDNIKASDLVKLLEEMFQNTSSWPTLEQVHAYHLQMERGPVRQHYYGSLIFS
jgi:hypothetical protein